MSFANPYFLVALAGVAAPVLIHLLTRDRMQRAAFSTLRFFAKGAKTVVRRKKVQEACCWPCALFLRRCLRLSSRGRFLAPNPPTPVMSMERRGWWCWMFRARCAAPD